MDGYGFKNWKDDYEYEDSFNNSDFRLDSKSHNGDDYEFDISNDLDYTRDSEKHNSRRKTVAVSSSGSFNNKQSIVTSSTRRASINDRAKEILERNKAIGKASGVKENTERLSSYKSTLADLMEGITMPDNVSSKTGKKMETDDFANNSRKKVGSQYDSPGESFEISASDMEVGTLAAKRAQEKAADRKRRMSLDRAPHSFPPRESVSASPDVSKFKKAQAGGPSGLQMSTALSSIHKSAGHPFMDRNKSDDLTRYGSVERSDADIYNMMADITADSGDGFEPHSESLVRASESSPFALSRAAPRRQSSRRSASEFSDVSESDEDREQHKPPNFEYDERRRKRSSTGVDSRSGSGDDASYHALSPSEPSKHLRARDSVEREEDDGDYSLDDFEEQHRDSPVKAAAVPAKEASKSVGEPAAALTHVEQIWNRWYSKDSEFLRMSADPPAADSEEKQSQPAPAEPVDPDPVGEHSTVDELSSRIVAETPALKIEVREDMHTQLSPEDPTGPGPRGLYQQQDEGRSSPSSPTPAPVSVPVPMLPSVKNALIGYQEVSVSPTPAQDIVPAGKENPVHVSQPHAWVEESAADPKVAHSLLQPRGGDAVNEAAALRDEALVSGTTTALDVEIGHNSQWASGNGDESHSPIQTVPQRSNMQFRVKNDSISADLVVTEDLLRRRTLAEPLPPHPPSGVAALLSSSGAREPPLLTYHHPRSDEQIPRQSISVPFGRQTTQRVNDGVSHDHNVVKGKKESGGNSALPASQQDLAVKAHSAAYDLHEAEALRSKKRFAAGTAAKLSQLQGQSPQDRKKRLATTRLQSKGGASSTSAGVTAATAVDTAALEEMKRGNQRLSGKIDRLARDVHSALQSVQENPSNPNSAVTQQNFAPSGDTSRTAEAHHSVADGRGGETSGRQSREAMGSVWREISQLRDSVAEVLVRGDTLSAREEILQQEKLLLKAVGVSGPVHSEKEQELLLEVERLKADKFSEQLSARLSHTELFRQELGLKLQFDSAQSLARSMHKSKLPVHFARSARGPLDHAAEAVSKDSVEVDRAQYENLLQDRVTQERLLAAYHKENQELMAAQKEREFAVTAMRADFFDRQEAQNKELNRLRNMLGLSDEPRPDNDHFSHLHSHARANASESLREVLHMDSVVRDLSEKLAAAKKLKDNTHELQATIGKLTADNEKLITANRSLTNEISELSRKVNDLTESNRAIFVEKAALSKTVAWYVDNQRLLDDAHAEKTLADEVCAGLKSELQQRGLMTPKEVNKLVNEIKRRQDAASTHETDIAASGVLERSRATDTSVATQAVASRQVRSPADIKRIKELQETIATLQKSHLSKNPNSVMSLVHAAAVSESVEARSLQQEDTIRSLQQKLEEEQTLRAMNHRSAKQEMERLKAIFSSQLAEVKAKAHSVAEQKKPVALDRETEGEDAQRVRNFFSNKIEEMQRKHEAQMRALKRNSVGSDTQLPDRAINIPAHPTAAFEVTEQSRLVQSLSERNALLEEELMRTVQETGQLKAQIARMTPVAEPTPSGVSGTEGERRVQNQSGDSRSPTDALVQVLQEELVRSREHAAQAIKDTQELCDRRVQELVQGHQRELERLSLRSLSEKEALDQSLRAQEEKYSDLLLRLASVSPEKSILSSNPTLQSFAGVELQLSEMEKRMRRREEEFSRAASEGRTAAKMELARLQALHAQDLRDKDQQMSAIRSELLQLLSAFQELKKRNEAAQ